MTSKVVMIARTNPNPKIVEAEMSGLDYDLEVHQVASQGEAIEAIKGADIIINQGVALPARSSRRSTRPRLSSASGTDSTTSTTMPRPIRG